MAWYGVMGYPPGLAENHPPKSLGGFRTRDDALKVKAEAEPSQEHKVSRRQESYDHIEVWHDTVSHPDHPDWCVSLCAPDGGEVVCLTTHDDEGDAIADGREVAIEHGLMLLLRSVDGSTESIETGDE